MARAISTDTQRIPSYRIDPDTGVLVTATTLIGTSHTTLQAWEATEVTGHSVLRSRPARPDGRYWGLITSRPAPAEVTDLPGGSPERIAACQALWAEQQLIALAAILRAYPEVCHAGGWQRDGGSLFALDAIATDDPEVVA